MSSVELRKSKLRNLLEEEEERDINIMPKLRYTGRKRGYELAINSPSEVYMCKITSVAYQN